MNLKEQFKVCSTYNYFDIWELPDFLSDENQTNCADTEMLLRKTGNYFMIFFLVISIY